MKQSYCLGFVIVLIGLCSASCGERPADVATSHTSESLAVVQRRIADGEAVLVDVREQSEWDEGHVAGAILLPISQLREGIDPDALAEQLPNDKIIYTHCRAGRRATAACDLLKDVGYNVRALKPGYQELIDAGFERAED